MSFDERFFETIFTEFRDNPHLGITSGVSFVFRDGGLVHDKSAPDHTLGATKVYRMSCFRAIGGLVPTMGWDGIDEIKARMNGWDARPIHDLVVIHHRPEGAALGSFAWGLRRGHGSYFMGYHPVFLCARALGRMFRLRNAVDGIGMIVGYFSCLLRGAPRIDDGAFIRFLRRNQTRKLLLLKTEF
jgi:hypothetical protein